LTKLQEEMSEQMELRTFYQKTREARGYSYGEIETGYLHSSQISRFEKGESMFSAECLLLAIQGLNMTPTEFFALMPTYEPSRLHVFMKQMSDYAINNDIEGMKKLLKPRAKKKNDKIYNVMVKVAIYDSSGENLITDNDRKLIQDYLTSIEQWTLFEIDVFSNCLEALSLKEAYYLGLEMLDCDELSNLLYSHADVVKRTLVNLYVHMVCNEQYTRANRIKNELEELLDAWDMEGKIIVSIFETFSKFKQEKSSELFEEIQSDIQVLKKFGIVDLAKRIEMFMAKEH
jgi:transcriptional activator, Rgg/GadR/MutR family, C-terminal domain